MPYDAVVSYLEPDAQSKEAVSRDLAERLSVALRKYHADHDLQGLSVKYSLCGKNNGYQKNYQMDLRQWRRAFNSFNLTPSNSYKRYMAVIKHKTDAEAIRSDWEAVGEDLSFAVVKNLIGRKDRSG